MRKAVSENLHRICQNMRACVSFIGAQRARLLATHPHTVPYMQIDDEARAARHRRTMVRLWHRIVLGYCVWSRWPGCRALIEVYKYTCIHIYILCILLYIYIYVYYIYIYICIYIYTYYMYIYAQYGCTYNISIYIHIYIINHRCIYIYIYIYI